MIKALSEYRAKPNRFLCVNCGKEIYIKLVTDRIGPIIEGEPPMFRMGVFWLHRHTNEENCNKMGLKEFKKK